LCKGKGKKKGGLDLSSCLIVSLAGKKEGREKDKTKLICEERRERREKTTNGRRENIYMLLLFYSKKSEKKRKTKYMRRQKEGELGLRKKRKGCRRLPICAFAQRKKKKKEGELVLVSVSLEKGERDCCHRGRGGEDCHLVKLFRYEGKGKKKGGGK